MPLTPSPLRIAVSLTRWRAEVPFGEKVCEKSSWRKEVVELEVEASSVTAVLSNWTWYFA